MASIFSRQLDCGLTLVIEPIASAGSVAMQWLLPAGSATDASENDGHATMLAEMIFRGAGGLSSREHSDAMDRVGLHRSSRVGTWHLQIAATMLGAKLAEALPLLTSLVRDPALPDEAVDPVRSLSLQTLETLDDDPQHLVMLNLRRRHITAPFNRHGYGTQSVLENVTGEQIRQAWRERFVPHGSILSAAGAVDHEALATQLDDLLGGWSGETREPTVAQKPPRGVDHTTQDTAQVHIGFAYDAPPEPHECSMLERLAMGVLSGGSSGRLFTEVRQKRSLCYSVGATYHAGRDRGYVTVYSGTMPDRAQETLDACCHEIERMREGVQRDEFDRAVVGLKSRLIMSGESTAARAAAIGYDTFRLGHPRTLGEIAAEVDAISFEQLNDYVASRETGEMTVATIGPSELTIPARETPAATS